MTRRARKSKPWVYRAPPTKTVQEIMVRLDAENMVKLLRELISYMPWSFKKQLRERGFLQFKVADHDILITTTGRFKQDSGEYGRAETREGGYHEGH